jgi:hypothetical protein
LFGSLYRFPTGELHYHQSNAGGKHFPIPQLDIGRTNGEYARQKTALMRGWMRSIHRYG